MHTNTKHKPFYVYSYTDVRPGREGEVIYIGKGSYSSGFRRMERHWKVATLTNSLFNGVLNKIRALGLAPIRAVVSWHDTEKEAFCAEMERISFHRLRMHGGTLCNLTMGGEGPTGYVHTEEQNRKTAAASVRMWEDEAFREKWTTAAKERMSDPAVRAAMAALADVLWQDPAHRAKMTTPEIAAIKSKAVSENWKKQEYRDMKSASLKATLAAPEGKAKKSQASTANWSSPEFKAKTSAAIKAAKTTPEARARVSAINSEIWASPEVRAKFSARMKEVLNNPEEKARKAAATKALWADPVFREKMRIARQAKKPA